MRVAVFINIQTPEAGGSYTFESQLIDVLLELHSESRHTFICYVSDRSIPNYISDTSVRFVSLDLTTIRYYHFAEGTVAGARGTISRTGYTGEDGFELYVDAKEAVSVWTQLLNAGVTPCGLGSRDSLRLEAGLALYGNDIDDTTTPLEANLGWLTKLAKGEFVGKGALAKQKEQGIERKLVGFTTTERSFPRHEHRGRDLGRRRICDGRPHRGTAENR